LKNEITQFWEQCLDQAIDKFPESTLRITEELAEMAGKACAWVDYAWSKPHLLDVFNETYHAVEDIYQEKGPTTIILSRLKKEGVFDA